MSKISTDLRSKSISSAVGNQLTTILGLGLNHAQISSFHCTFVIVLRFSGDHIKLRRTGAIALRFSGYID
jgi:hypothetical protein